MHGSPRGSAAIVSAMRRTGLKFAHPATVVSAGLALVIAITTAPILGLLLLADDPTLNRWADIGQAVSPVGILSQERALRS